MTTFDSPQVSTIAAAFCALALTVGANAGCRDVHGEAIAAPRPVKVMGVRALKTSAAARYSASITPNEQITLAFKTSGYVDQVLQRRGADGRMRALQAGDAVPAGAVLARVREADYQERVNQAVGSLGELEATQAKATLDLERARTLFAAQALTKPDLDAAQASYDVTLARIVAAKAQLETARLSLKDTALVAPRGGIILDRKIEIGSLVAGGSIGFVLADVSSVKAVFGVPDSLLPRLSPGQPLTITTEAFRGRSFAGRVTAVSPSADSQSRVFDIEVTIPNRDGELRPGMIGAVELLPEPSAAAGRFTSPAVPLAAVVHADTRPDQYSLFIVAGDSVARLRAVKLGAIEGNLVSVTSGLESGERVVVMGATLLKDGDSVRVIP